MTAYIGISRLVYFIVFMLSLAQTCSWIGDSEAGPACFMTIITLVLFGLFIWSFVV